MFAEDGYDLILGFRENVSAAEKFKKELIEKYDGQNVMKKYENNVYIYFSLHSTTLFLSAKN